MSPRHLPRLPNKMIFASCSQIQPTNTMNKGKRELPDHLADNVSSKCFVFRHPNLFRRKSVVFSYARGVDKEAVKTKAVSFAVKMNEALGPVPTTSPEGRMTSRNRSGRVCIHPRRTIAKRNGLPYYAWTARWKGCPLKGGISWPCITHTDDDAHVLAALSLDLRTTNRPKILEEYAKIIGTAAYKGRLITRPKLRIEEYWPESTI